MEENLFSYVVSSVPPNEASKSIGMVKLELNS